MSACIFGPMFSIHGRFLFEVQYRKNKSDINIYQNVFRRGRSIKPSILPAIKNICVHKRVRKVHCNPAEARQIVTCASTHLGVWIKEDI